MYEAVLMLVLPFGRQMPLLWKLFICVVLRHNRHIAKFWKLLSVDLREKGYTILAVEQAEGSTFLQNFEIKKDAKYAVIFGNEVKGVSDEVMALVDTCIEVPQFQEDYLRLKKPARNAGLSSVWAKYF